tara:strand:+ start:192 stop:704 length:513 start_codon:yes stop_codon:yes gene_type:complete
MKQDTNNYWEQLERLEKLIRASELKAGIIFSFHSLILGLFIDRLENFEAIFKESTLVFIFAICWIIMVLISIFYCFKCFHPKMELKNEENVFFFRDAALKYGNIKQYAQKLTQVCETEEEIINQLSQQIFVESKIVNQKFISVQKAIKSFAISFIFVIFILVFWGFSIDF